MVMMVLTWSGVDRKSNQIDVWHTSKEVVYLAWLAQQIMAKRMSIVAFAIWSDLDFCAGMEGFISSKAYNHDLAVMSWGVWMCC